MAQPLAGLETEADEAGPSGAVAFPAGTANSEEDLGVAVVMSDGTMCIREDEMRRIMQSLNSYIRDPMPFEKMVRLFVEPVYHRSDSRATCRALRKAARKQNLSKEALLRDIVWMVNLFVACGSNISKMEERLDTQEFAMFKRLEERYNLLEKATAGVLTLSSAYFQCLHSPVWPRLFIMPLFMPQSSSGTGYQSPRKRCA
nr:uncharacterized protein LOC119168436 [Rhipicephalus microplus]